MVFLECSNAGQFNSITRRNRRSIDQSYPEDRPSYGEASILSLTASTGGFYNNNSIPVDEEPISSHKRVHDTEVLRQQVDQSDKQDERIEGLEAMVAKMQRTLKVSWRVVNNKNLATYQYVLNYSASI